MIYITGHTKGLGRAMHDWFVEMGWDVHGLSRRENFDITEYEDYKQGFLKLGMYDTVINNAYCGTGQSMLLMWLWQHYPNIHVINIGSVSADRTDAIKPQQITYSANKAHLRNIHEHVVRNGFKSTLIELGMCDTEYNRDKPGPKIDPASLAFFIESTLLSHQIYIRKITLTKE